MKTFKLLIVSLENENSFYLTMTHETAEQAKSHAEKIFVDSYVHSIEEIPQQ